MVNVDSGSISETSGTTALLATDHYIRSSG
ncbi:hypothetical protein PDB1_05749 [Pseudomonas aeruginosa]